MLESNEAVVVVAEADGRQQLDTSELLGGRSCGSGCAVSIEGPDRPFGYLAVFRLTARDLQPVEVEVVEAAAEALSLALGRLRSERRFAAQRGVIEVIAASETLAGASSRLLALIGSGIGWDAATLWLVDEAAARLRCVNSWHAPGVAEEFARANLGWEFERNEGIAGTVWERGEPEWVTDLPNHPGFVRAEIARDAGLHSGFLFPIVAAGRVAGIFELFTRAVQQPDEPLLADLTAFGSQIGRLLERELTSAELRRTTRELRMVLDNLGTGVVAINADGSLRLANTAAARAAGLERADDLLTVDEEELRSRFRFFDERGNELPRELRPRSRVLKGEDVQSMLLKAVEDHGAERWYQVRASPIIDESGDLLCAIATFDDVSELKRSEESLRRSEEVHRRIGEVLQRGLLPPAMPEIPSIDLAVRFRALGDRTLIGGDFYDAFPVSGDRWMIVVGDIAGKGVEAAAFTALVRYTIRAVAVRDRDPAAALAQLNEMLIEDPTQPRLCTALCALVESSHPAQVTVARGGHSPPLLLANGDSRPRRIEPIGPILGAFEDAAFDTETFSLGPKDSLVMYTDGVSDAGIRTDRGALEIEGLERQLLAARDEEAEDLATAIDAAAAAADRGLQHDDALVVVLRGH